MTNEKVVTLPSHQKKLQATGETTFMLCSCGSEDGLLPVVLHDANTNPLLMSLVCPACEAEFHVLNGRVFPPEAT